MSFHYGDPDTEEEFLADADYSPNVYQAPSSCHQHVDHVDYSAGINLDRSLDEYNLTPTAEPEVMAHHPDDTEEHETSAPHGICFLNLAYHIEHEFKNPCNVY